MEINGPLLIERLNLGNFPTGGVIGLATATVDVVAGIGINQTTAGQTLTLPTPTDTRDGRCVSIANSGTQSFTINGVVLAPNSYSSFECHGSAWRSLTVAATTSTVLDTFFSTVAYPQNSIVLYNGNVWQAMSNQAAGPFNALFWYPLLTGKAVGTYNSVYNSAIAYSAGVVVADASATGNLFYATQATVVLAAGAFVVGQSYAIATLGTTDYTLIGSSANTVGKIFTATGIGAGTGTASQSYQNPLYFQPITNNAAQLTPFFGATAALPGTAGTVPVPVAGQQTQFLRGDGTWASASGTDTVQTVATTGAVTVTNWGSVVLIPTLTGPLTLTLPTVVGNTGKKVTFIQVGTPNAFAVTLAANGAQVLTLQSSGTEFTQINGALTVEAVDATNARQISNIGATAVISEFGNVLLNDQTFSTNVYAASTNGTYNITSAGVWELCYNLMTDGTGANANNQFRIVDSLGVLVPGSDKTRGGASTATEGLDAVALRVTTTGATTYTLQGRNGGSGSARILSTVNSTSTISWAKVGGYLPAMGTSVAYSYIQDVIPGAAVSVASTGSILYTGSGSASGAIPYNSATGQWTLTAGATYSLEAVASTNAAGGIVYQWSNDTLGAFVGSIGFTNGDNGTSGNQMQPVASYVFAPTSTTLVSVRNISGAARGFPSLAAGAVSNYAKVTQIGTSAVTQFTGATATGGGVGGYVPAPIVGDQYAKLYGDSTWKYTNASKSVALGNLAANGLLTTPANMQKYDAFDIVQTTANITATLPTPTDTIPGRTVTMRNLLTSTAPINVAGVEIPIGGVAEFSLNDIGWLPAFGKTPVVTRFTVSGTYTPTFGMRYVIVKAWGGGGAGGGSVVSTLNNISIGAGGGSGAYGEALFTASQIGVSKAIVIPAAAAGVVGGTGTNATTTTFGVTLLTAPGGAGGTASGVGANSNVNGASGGGVATTTGVPIILAAGNRGDNGWGTNLGSIAGGSSGRAGDGAASIYGAGGIGANLSNNTIGTPVTATGLVAATTAYGAGGGGSITVNASTAAAGTAGRSGIVVVTEYF